MMTYKIKLVSQGNAVILIFSLIAIIIIGRVVFLPKNLDTAAVVVVSVTCFITTYFLWQKFVTGRTEWTIDQSGITITWTRKFAWTKSKDLKFLWTEITAITRWSDLRYPGLKIDFVSGDTIKFHHDMLTTGDDFDRLKNVLFQKMIDRKHKHPSSKPLA